MLWPQDLSPRRDSLVPVGFGLGIFACPVVQSAQVAVAGSRQIVLLAQNAVENLQDLGSGADGFAEFASVVEPLDFRILGMGIRQLPALIRRQASERLGVL